MSKKQKTNKKNFSYTTTADLPSLGTIKTKWELDRLYYKGVKDPQIEKDLKKTEKAYLAFAAKWRKKDFTKSATALLEALSEYEALSAMPESSKAGRYFSLRTALDANDHVAEKQLALLSERMRKLGNEIIYFGLTLGKIPKKDQVKFLKNKKLAPYHYYLERIWLGAAHDLSEAEEKIINLKGRQSYGMWVDMVEKIVSNRTVSFKGKNIPVNEALELLDTLSAPDKKKVWELIMTEMEQIAEVSEHEFNAIISDVRAEEELRGYKKPYSSTALSYEDTEESIENLVEAVSTKGFALSRKFYKLKAKYHGVDKLHYTQKYDSIGPDLEIPFEQSVDICRDVFYGVKNEYGEIFDTMLTNGQIDAYPKAGKRGGAFMSSSVNHPTHVFLNHLNNFKSLETLAHEMGHAIHSERSKSQQPFYQGHSITTAETASTLFENLLFDAVYDQANDTDKPALLHDRVARDIATIERQIACFNAELEIHNTIKAQGAMTKLELRDTMFKHLKAYTGPAIELNEQDGYSYVYWSHLRYGFYVYTYTFGILMSTIMANHYKADRSYATQIDKFLCSGQSDTVANIMKSIGIDTTKPDTFTEALKNHEQDINAFAKIVAKK